MMTDLDGQQRCFAGISHIHEPFPFRDSILSSPHVWCFWVSRNLPKLTKPDWKLNRVTRLNRPRLDTGERPAYYRTRFESTRLAANLLNTAVAGSRQILRNRRRLPVSRIPEERRRKNDVRRRREIPEAGLERILAHRPSVPDRLQGDQLHPQSRLSRAPQEPQIRRPRRRPRRLPSPSRVSPLRQGSGLGVRWSTCPPFNVILYRFRRFRFENRLIASEVRDAVLQRRIEGTRFGCARVRAWLCRMLSDIWNGLSFYAKHGDFRLQMYIGYGHHVRVSEFTYLNWGIRKFMQSK